MTDYIQHRKTADEVVADLDAQMIERLERNFGNMTLWHEDAATLLRRYREMSGEIATLLLQQQTDRETIASLLSASAPSPASGSFQAPDEPLREVIARIIDPSRWAVLDGYLAQMLRKYAGQDAGYDPDNFKDKASLAKADAILSALAVGGRSSVADCTGEGLRPFASEGLRKSDGDES